MLEKKVTAFLERHSFKLNNKKIVVGVSGGPDSLALLHFLLGERDKMNLSIVAAHVDHMFRGQESYEDAMFVKNFCEQNQVPFEMARINVPKIMEDTGKSSQLAAREARYDFYLSTMEKYDFPFLALGHHGDDQIETMLMRATRGSTGMARAGIPFSRPFHKGRIFRPFLCLSKDEIWSYCKFNELTPRLDPSNEKGVYSRNRFRKQVLPFLKTENPHVNENFQRFSEDLQSDETFLLELTERHMNTVVKIREKSKIAIDINQFLEVPLPLQRRGIQLILNYLYMGKSADLSAVHIEQVYHLIRHSEPSGKLDFPSGLKVIRSYHQLSFQFQADQVKPYFFEVNEPGTILLPSKGNIRIERAKDDIPTNKPYMALFNEEKLKWPIIIRTRHIGDRMTLKGMQGSKKLKDIFIDQKIPVHDRDNWPVITDSDGNIIWLPGLKKSSFEGIDSAAKQYILLTYNK
ncbi:tRNA lysidine(34) synthetase TilS [Neobacillus bataviensis]|uniref:tRNA lysidine(34) synthetase TilS n=1 Tax=Neobacillus bataviensis TaxID=220685 RepID=UPI001CBA7354|nr:tRNA lysidine(34) synthetase TilS [Neobacillus bataviensis]